MPVEQVNRFGGAGDFTLLESSDTAEFVRKCEAGTQEDLVAAIRELIGQATGAQGSRSFYENADAPVAFAIFSTIRPRGSNIARISALFWEAEQVTFIDASRWMADRTDVCGSSASYGGGRSAIQ